MNKEMGSEFWNNGPVKKNQVYLLSGRTALDYIIRDIKKTHKVCSALLPSYCCHTMIEPFIRNKIPVRFYDIYFDELQGITADIPGLKENEIFYYIEYFGFAKISGIDVKEIKNHNAIIIEDCTHSWGYKGEELFSDYLYASYRKWTGFDAIAVAQKRQGSFKEFPTLHNERYCELRRKAAELKRRFIENGEETKSEFLALFNEAEELLEDDYVDYLPMKDTMADFFCWDKCEMVNRRRKNAKIILDELQDIPQIQLLFSELAEGDVPLFVPILVKDGRAELREFLTKNRVYCPIHWPLSDYHADISEKARELYTEELSLICDQRYEIDDIKRMTGLIKQFYER